MLLLYRDYIGIMQRKLKLLYRGYIGIMEKKMETIVSGLYWDNGKENGNHYIRIILG